MAIALPEGLAMLAHHIGHFDLGAVDDRWFRAVGWVMWSGIRGHHRVMGRMDDEHGRTPSRAVDTGLDVFGMSRHYTKERTVSDASLAL
jgi:hypothetical protein